MRIRTIILATLICFTSFFVRADEGMWIPSLLKTLNESDMQTKGLKLSAEDIYSINHSSLKDAIVHFGGGCTAEVISNEGLILTNHHCGYSRIQAHSSVENDYLTDGFWAMTRAEELKNPGLTATFIVRIQDVSEDIYAGVIETMVDSVRSKTITENFKRIEKDAEEGTNYKARIRPFNYGNSYFLIVTETFEDVRLVGAPPSSIGKFGFDTDNWVWPRHTGDFSIFRIYADADNNSAKYAEDNVPYKPKHSLPISLEGVKEGDFTMVYGFPGRTFQYLPSYAISHLVEQSLPAKMKMRETSLGIINEAMRSSKKINIQYAAKQSRISNSYKKWIGQIQGLRRLHAIEKKKATEAEFTMRVMQSQPSIAEYGIVLETLKKWYDYDAKYAMASDYFWEFYRYGPEILNFANRWKKLADDFDELSEVKLADRVGIMTRNTRSHFKNYHLPTDIKLFKAMVQLYYDGLEEELRPEILETILKKYKGGFDEYVDELYEKSYFVDSTKAMSLLTNFDKASVSKIKKDPAYVFVTDLIETYDTKVEPDDKTAKQYINYMMQQLVKGMMELMPERTYWYDANSTLRLTYGKIEGSEPRDGMKYKYYTTLEGVVEKYKPNDYEFDVPKKLIDLYYKKDYGQYAQDGEMFVCLTGSNHTTGGNSGSPALNGEGHLIGLNFDRSWESTMSDYMFDPTRCRNIMVDIRYVLFIVDKFAGATHLVEEMNLITTESRLQIEIESMRKKVQEKTEQIRKSPNNHQLLLDRGVLYYHLMMQNEAVNDVLAVLRADKNNTAAMLQMAKIEYDAGNYKKVIEQLDRLLKVDANHIDGLVLRAKTFRKKKEYKNVIIVCDRILKLDPAHGECYLERGVANFELGKKAASCIDFKTAEKLGEVVEDKYQCTEK
jgi:hypothetical protein